MIKKYKFWLLGGLALILVLSWILHKSDTSGKNAPEVETGKAVRRTIVETVMASGFVQPEKEVKISSEVSGEIIDLPVREGQQVQKGDLLVRINPDLYQSALERAMAALSNAQAALNQQKVRLRQARTDFERTKQLYEKGIVAQADFQQAKTNYEVAQATYKAAQFQVKSAQASVKEARDNMKRTVIYAPISGTVTRLNVEKGERVVGTKQMAGTEIMRIADLNRMEVLTDVNENDIVKVKIKDTALIEIEAFPGRQFKGIVTEIANSAQTQSNATDQVVNFKVKVAILPQSYADLTARHGEQYSPFRPGMSASVDIVTARRENVVSVPVSAVTIRRDSTGKQRETVFLLKDNTVRQQFVKTGVQDENFIEIIEGVQENQTVITGPYQLVSKRLKDGMKVKTKTEGQSKKFKKHRS